MQVGDLVRLAALVATHGPALVDSRQPIVEERLVQYWAASRCRFDRWARSIKQLAAPSARTRTGQRLLLRSIVTEVLQSEILARVWAALLTSYDHSHFTCDAGTIARNVLFGQIASRQRVLGLLLDGPGVAIADFQQLNSMRRQAECWTDLLIGRLCQCHDVSSLAIRPERALSFAGDLKFEGATAEGGLSWSLMLSSLSAAVQTTGSAVCGNHDLNEQIAGSILLCFPAGLIDNSHVFRSLWMARLWHLTIDAQSLVGGL